MGSVGKRRNDINCVSLKYVLVAIGSSLRYGIGVNIHTVSVNTFISKRLNYTTVGATHLHDCGVLW